MTKNAHLSLVRIIGFLTVCGLLFCSWRIAVADLLAESSDRELVRHAISLEPDNFEIRTRLALRDLYDLNIQREDVESEFKEIVKLNSYSSEAMMALGLLAEARRDNQRAEAFFVKATELDHTFKPVWTLANFYVRTNQIGKIWAPIQSALEITTRPKLNFFDPNSIFDLCWNTGANPGEIYASVPKRAEAVLPYFYYLVLHERLEAAQEVYPEASSFADSSLPINRDSFPGYCSMLFRAHHVREAVDVWNLMVRKHLITSTVLDVEKADFIANPSFQFPLDPGPFGWLTARNKGIDSFYAPGAFWVELDGDQPDFAVLLDKNLPVLPAREYVLSWIADGSGIRIPADRSESGVGLQFYNGDKTLAANCSKMFVAPDKSGCVFRIPESVEAVRMVLVYQRPLGSVRMRGRVKVSNFNLKIQNRDD